MIEGYQLTQAISVAATLGIADLLATGTKTADELARATGAHPQSLLRLLRALASQRIFAEESEAVFGLTPLAEGLQSDEAGSLRASAIQCGQPYMWTAWGQLMHSVMTGESAFQEVHGMSAWEYRERYPSAGEMFDDAMHEGAQEVAAPIVNAYTFDNVGSVVDVGGGNGALLLALLNAYPDLHGVLYDQQHVITRAKDMLERTAVADQCSIASGDFFESVPEGGDVYILKGIIHDWGDSDAVRILETCRRAMSPKNRLLLIEQIVSPEPTEDSFTLLMDLHMLTIHGARERTKGELAQLLTSAGFEATRIIPTTSALSLVEAIPA